MNYANFALYKKSKTKVLGMKLNLRDKVTVVVNTCDAYSDLWEMFYLALEEYWPNRTIDLIVNTELKTELGFESNRVSVHNSTSQYWGERLIETLSDVDADYVITLYDDFIIEASFDESIIENAIEWMENESNISVFYLDDLKLESVTDSNYYDGFELIEPRADFRLNSAPAVWRKSELIKYTGKEDSPWAWEVFGTYRTQKNNNKFYQPLNKIYKFNGAKGGAIYRGQWVKEVVVDKAKKYNLTIDFNKRGFSSDTTFEKRSLLWKLKFILLGYKMVGFDVFKFIRNALKSKLSKKRLN